MSVAASTATAPATRKHSRLKKTVATAAVATALVGVGVSTAQAAGLVAPGSSTYVSTNLWGASRICVTNYGAAWGSFTLYANFASPEQNWVPGYSTRCRDAWWFGQNVRVQNTGSTMEYVYRGF
ncbi:hypothetical protein V1639_10435 [Pseudarthrobacter sp. J75]|uniref:hypothetical protein n=1 Tax=unclassified Pseudarthrobacter TaxID=2647000 RepID=UPI002E80752E|nr:MULTISPECIES: hypothetical protein [unclassified Pseudarthrobacter]MEE2522964.1 hypothetical protein [Pseudarthrobacter sp. J47]MEE2529442.1 hypothetical protein [Pseudarthrobacter sp. J75]MEE2568640.1 hypothetical protein [Pseudarthrobacter sp. J64]